MDQALRIVTGGAYSSFEAQPYSPRIGAIIHGLDASKPLDAPARAELQAALVQYEVIFLRRQTMNPAQLVEFARVFGQVDAVKAFFPKLPEHPQVEVVESTADKPAANNNWHADITWQRNPPAGTCLQAITLPPSGGDTLWASMTQAFQGLTPSLQHEIANMIAVHAWEISGWPDYIRNQENGERALAQARLDFPPVEHPVVRAHPVSGKPVLYVNPTFASHIKGLTRADSDGILGRLFAAIQLPENQLRWRWKPGDVAVWDNNSTQHYAVADFFPHHRKLHRVTFNPPLTRD